jgi:hypothetical protein
VTNPAAALLLKLAGTWTCAATVAGAPLAPTTLSFAPFGNSWLVGTRYYAAVASRPAHTEDIVFGYDPRKKRWIEFDVDSDGKYGLYQSASDPNATVTEWSDVYPIDAADGTTTVNFAGSTVSGVSHYRVRRKPMEDHFTCRRQRAEAVIRTITVGPNAAPTPSASRGPAR